jgi:hypothetical protein
MNFDFSRMLCVAMCVCRMDEFSAIANDFVPASFNSGNFPLSLTPPPKTCPLSGTFDLLLTLPHYYGSAVNVSVTTNPPGLASVVLSPGPYVYWDTSLSPASRKKEQTIRVACSTLQDLTTVSLSLTSDSDTFHYSLAEDSRDFTVSQTLPPAILALNFSSPLLQPLNGAQVTTVAAAPFASPLVVFDGYSSFLDLNTAADTGVLPQAALGGLNIPEYLQSPDLTGQLQPGWSAEGWYQALSLAHPATLFSCGQKEASEQLTTWSGNERNGPALRSIVVSMSGTEQQPRQRALRSALCSDGLFGLPLTSRFFALPCCCGFLLFLPQSRFQCVRLRFLCHHCSTLLAVLRLEWWGVLHMSILFSTHPWPMVKQAPHTEPPCKQPRTEASSNLRSHFHRPHFSVPFFASGSIGL